MKFVRASGEALARTLLSSIVLVIVWIAALTLCRFLPIRFKLVWNGYPDGATRTPDAGFVYIRPGRVRPNFDVAHMPPIFQNHCHGGGVISIERNLHVNSCGQLRLFKIINE